VRAISCTSPLLTYTTTMTTILSWNVNGLRAIQRKGNWDELIQHDADIFCLQETKSRPEQLTDNVRKPDGYHSYFTWPEVKKGYSGIALYSKKKPNNVVYGLDASDNPATAEGRMITAFYDRFVLIACYFPNGGGGPERLAYKLDFYDRFLEYVETLRNDGHDVIFCGDVNTAHHEIDLARPKANEKNTGFLPEERAWLDEVQAHGWVDIFRAHFPGKVDQYTYWDMKTRARERNVGWRIDYFFTTPVIAQKITKVRHIVDQYGSDHCPVEIVLKYL